MDTTTNNSKTRRRGVQGESPLPDHQPSVIPTNAHRHDDNNTSVKSNMYNNIHDGTTANGGNCDYYDDDDEEMKHEKMYRGACSLGQFCLNPCACLITTGGKCSAWCKISSLLRSDVSEGVNPSRGKSPTKARRRLDGILTRRPVLVLVVFFICFLLSLLLFRDSRNHYVLRPMTDGDVDQLQIVIPRYDFNKNDIGGWMFPQFFIEPPIPADPFGKYHADHGDLLYLPFEGTSRVIHPNDHERYENYRENVTLLDSSSRISHYYWYDEELEDRNVRCRRPNWTMLYNPSCNAMHELRINAMPNPDVLSLGNDEIFDAHRVSHGAYRDVWLVDEATGNHTVVGALKTIRWKASNMVENLQTVLRDALIMERLTASPRIVDVYSHCGTSVLVEAIPNEVEEFIVPGSGYIAQQKLHDEHSLNPQNPYNPEEKLEMAIAMAESLADLHGFRDGIIVHDDVQLCQWLRLDNGKIKLGDFNRAEIMPFNSKAEEYCTYINGECYGNYRAPEEFAADELNQQIDVFTLGNNIYALLTGLWVFYENTDDGVVQKDLIDGKLAYVDPRYRERSFIEGKLVEIMEKCWAYDPADRPEIFEVVSLLRQVEKENAALQH